MLASDACVAALTRTTFWLGSVDVSLLGLLDHADLFTCLFFFNNRKKVASAFQVCGPHIYNYGSTLFGSLFGHQHRQLDFF